MPPKRALWCRALALLLLAGSLDAEEAELLLPGQSRERPIAAGEAHVYRVEVTGVPLLVTVEQRGIDLVVETQGSDQATHTFDALNGAWGPEVVLLAGEALSEHRLEVRPGQHREQGIYTIRAEELSTATEEEARRVAALAALSRCSRPAYGEAEPQRQALASCREAVEGWRALGDRRWKAEALHGLAALELKAGEIRSAAEDFSQALVLWRDLGAPHREAGILGTLAQTHLQLGEIEAARDEMEKALALWQRLGERREEGAIRSEICSIEQRTGSLLAALACFEEALALFRQLGAGDQEARILNNLGGIYDLLGEPDAALERYEQALALRRKHGDRRGEAQTLINIAVIHRTLGAWQEALRLYGQVREIPGALGDRSLEAALLSNIGFTYNSLGEPQRASAFLQDALALRREIGDRRGEVIALNNLGLVQRSLGDLERAPGSFRSFVLPPQEEIEALARQIYEEMSTVEAGTRPLGKAAESLSQILLGPVWNETAGFHRLVVVPDAALHILPFSVLPVPEPGRSWNAPGARQPLLEHLEVAYIPSATTLALQRQRLERRLPAPKWAAILADPVFAADDPRLTVKKTVQKTTGNLFPSFERLSSSQREAESIQRLAPAGRQVWTALGLAASREAVLSGDLGSYRVVHFATHGIADARNPELSGLVLSQVDSAGHSREGFLGLTDIYELDLGADLVVLSGCQTALGREVRGEGLMGMTRGFLYAGVPRVVAGLWKVQDRTTAELMARFYQALWRESRSPAAALRQAQRSLQRDPRYRHPYSWAGFVLQGDWR